MNCCWGALIFISVVLIAVAAYGYRHLKQIGASLTAWGTPRTKICDGPKTIDDTCDPVLADPGKPPFGSNTVNAKYAAQVVGRLIAYIGTKDGKYITLSGMNGPTLITSPQDSALPLGAIWISPDGSTAVIAFRGTRTVKDLLSDLKFSELDINKRQQL